MDLNTILSNEGMRLRHTFESQKEGVENPVQSPVLSGCGIYYHNHKPRFVDVPSVTPRDNIEDLFFDFMIELFSRSGSVPSIAMYSWEGWLQKKINGVNTVDPRHRQIITVGVSDAGDHGVYVTPVLNGEVEDGFCDDGYREDEIMFQKMKEVQDVAENEGYASI
jgi:hypothetical protein